MYPHTMLRKQAGLSALGWLIVLGVVVSFATCGVKIIPIYLDNLYVQNALKSLSDNNANLKEMDRGDIEKKLISFMSVNSMDGISLDDFKYRRTGTGIVIDAIYEKREPIFGNLDVVVSFKNQLDSANPDLCCEYLLENPNEK